MARHPIVTKACYLEKMELLTGHHTCVIGRNQGMIYRTAKSVFAVFLIIAGIIVTPMPIPLGIIMIIIGLTLLASVSPKVKSWIKKVRIQYPGFSASLSRVKPKLPSFVRKVVEETDPHKI